MSEQELLYRSIRGCSNKKKGILSIETEGIPERDKLFRNYRRRLRVVFLLFVAFVRSRASRSSVSYTHLRAHET